MNELLITPSRGPSNINLNPESLEAEIAQNLIMIATTKVGTVPYNRLFGFDFYMLDMPINQAKAMYSKELIEKVKRFEPRAEIKEIEYKTDDLNGRLLPQIKWRIKR